MPLTNAQRQKRYRRKVQTGRLIRFDMCLPEGVGHKLDYLADHWDCTKTQALSRCLMETWAREGEPIPGFEDE